MYLSNFNKNFYKTLFKFTLYTFLFVVIDAYIQFSFGKNLFGEAIYYLKDPQTLNITTRISGIFGDEFLTAKYPLLIL